MNMADEGENLTQVFTNFQVNLDKKIGNGSFGIVYTANMEADTSIYAAKEITYLKGEANSNALTVCEPSQERTFRDLKHQNITQTIIYHDDTRLWFVMEYCDLKDLRHYLNSKPMTMTEKLKVMYETSSALAYLHSRALVHCDIKLENVLLKSHGKDQIAKITDFGMCRMFRVTKKQLQTMDIFEGTREFMAPELFVGQSAEPWQHNFIDTFSLGLVFLVLSLHKNPGDGLMPLSGMFSFILCTFFFFYSCFTHYVQCVPAVQNKEFDFVYFFFYKM